MTTQASEVDRAIDLLRSLIERSPGDAHNRLRLLNLLHAERRRQDFVVEAYGYKAHCDLTFDTNWARICEMGQEIDPRNGFFGRPSKAKKRRTSRRRSATPRRRRSVSASNAKSEAPNQRTAAPRPEAQREEAAHDGSNRRALAERRVMDRRRNFSPWFGQERRRHQRRQKRRRAADGGRRKARF